jgi:hypothetical protein
VRQLTGWLAAYANDAFDRIDGWVDRGALGILAALDEVQTRRGIAGGVAEIGVFHGRFFIAMNGLVTDPSVRSIAVDLFELQDLNIDSSGHGDADAFRANLAQHDRHRGENVVLLSADSTRLTPSDILDHLNARPKIVSVDGGHTPEHTISDLQLASGVVGGFGMVILDDVLNPYWLGVIEGTVRYLEQRPTLWPVAIGHNKLLLCPMSAHRTYLDALRPVIDARGNVRLCGYELLVL